MRSGVLITYFAGKGGEIFKVRMVGMIVGIFVFLFFNLRSYPYIAVLCDKAVLCSDL